MRQINAASAAGLVKIDLPHRLSNLWELVLAGQDSKG